MLTADSETALEGQAAEAVHAVMSVRTRELIRAALADSLNGVDPERTARILTDTTDAVLDGVLSLATGVVIALRDGVDAVASGPERDGTWSGALARHAMIAMGRLGGAETTYASDADVLFVHEARPGADPHEAADEAEAVARWVVRLLSQAQPHPFEVDADLRPEGRQGPMSRSLGSYADYYERWSAVWERQALLRARACAGDVELGRAFEELVEPLRWSPDGLDDDGLRQIRRLKARMEAERLPRGTACPTSSGRCRSCSSSTRRECRDCVQRRLWKLLTRRDRRACSPRMRSPLCAVPGCWPHGCGRRPSSALGGTMESALKFFPTV